jgi:hypothetical protein
MHACAASSSAWWRSARTWPACLDSLLTEARAGRAYFKVYRQFKMYNDPSAQSLPVREAQRGGAGAP